MPRLFDPIIQPLLVDHPDFGRRDWPGVVFAAPVPSRYAAGTRARLSGWVTDGSQEFDSVLVRFWKHDGDSTDALRYWASVGPDGEFAMDIEPAAWQTGSYAMSVFLFWPDSGAQHPQAILSPVVVD